MERTTTIPTTDASAKDAAETSASVVTVRRDLMAQLGVAARLARPNVGQVVTTERLTLRPLALSDKAEFLRVLRISRGHLAEFCPLSSGEGPDAETEDAIFDRQVALSDGAVRTGRAWRVGAFDADGRMVGAFNINDIARGLEHTGELVFWLSADATRRGYAQECTQAAIDFALADLPRGLGLHRITALIAPANKPCLSLARKLGLKMDMDSPPTMLTLNGRPVSHDTYHVFASVGAASVEASTAEVRVVEGKPSIVEELFGRGLLSILRTEAASTPHVGDSAQNPPTPTTPSAGAPEGAHGD